MLHCLRNVWKEQGTQGRSIPQVAVVRENLVSEEDVWGAPVERRAEQALHSDLDVALPPGYDQETVRRVKHALAAADGQVPTARKGKLQNR